MTAPAQEHVRRELVRGSAALVARSDALARLAQMMGAAVEDIGPDAAADDVERRAGAVEAAVNRSVSILLEALAEASAMAAMARVRAEMEVDRG